MEPVVLEKFAAAVLQSDSAQRRMLLSSLLKIDMCQEIVRELSPHWVSHWPSRPPQITAINISASATYRLIMASSRSEDDKNTMIRIVHNVSRPRWILQFDFAEAWL